MPRLLPLRNDPEQRVICSVCRNLHGDNFGRWAFQEFETTPGVQSFDVKQYELQGKHESAKRRALTPTPGPWGGYDPRTMFCVECRSRDGNNYMVYNPRTHEQVVGDWSGGVMYLHDSQGRAVALIPDDEPNRVYTLDGSLLIGSVDQSQPERTVSLGRGYVANITGVRIYVYRGRKQQIDSEAPVTGGPTYAVPLKATPPTPGPQALPGHAVDFDPNA